MTSFAQPKATLTAGDWPSVAPQHSGRSASNRQRTVRRSPRKVQDDLALWAVDAALSGTIFLVPFLMGGRHPLGRLVLVALSAVAVAAWLLRRSSESVLSTRGRLGLVVLALGTLLAMLQIVPLPTGLLGWLSPATGELLPLWHANKDGPSLGVWQTISLAPHETRAALTMWLAYGGLFWVTAQRVRTYDDVSRILRWIAVSAMAMAGFGLLQFLTSNGRFFWCYDYPDSDTERFVKGAFTNRNHFAQAMALGLGPTLVWLAERMSPGRESRHPGQRDRETVITAAVAGGLALITLAGLLTLSRGGALAMATAGLVAVGLLWRAGRVTGRMFAGLASVSLVLIALLGVYGAGQVTDRLDDFSAGSMEDLDRLGARRAIWEANLAGIARFPKFGSGLGTHRDVYPLFLKGFGDFDFTHSENGYLQVALETGIGGALLLTACLLLAGRWAYLACRRDAQTTTVAAALCAMIAASAVHSIVDFVWYVPALSAIVAMAIGCLSSLARANDARPSEESPVRTVWDRYGYRALAAGAMVLGLCSASYWAARAAAQPAWERYLLLARTETTDDLLSVADASSTVDGEPLDAARVAEAESRRREAALDHVRQTVALLGRFVQLHPQDGRGHLRLASTYLRQFDLEQQSAANAMSVVEIREAATAAKFASSAELRSWLQRSVGPGARHLSAAYTHARLGVARQPLLGEGYLLLSELSFLDSHHVGRGPIMQRRYLSQAQLVRPHDGSVLFGLGKEALVAGRPAEALRYWKQAYAAGQRHEQRIVDTLAGRLPARFLIAQFQPRLSTLRMLHHRYAPLGRRDDLAALAERFQQAADVETAELVSIEAAQVWVEVHRLLRQLDQTDKALVASRRAVERDPHSFGPHFALADDLLAARQYPAAVEAYRWCLARRPSDARVARGLKAALDGGRRG